MRSSIKEYENGSEVLRETILGADFVFDKNKYKRSIFKRAFDLIFRRKISRKWSFYKLYSRHTSEDMLQLEEAHKMVICELQRIYGDVVSIDICNAYYSVYFNFDTFEECLLADKTFTIVNKFLQREIYPLYGKKNYAE